MGLRRRYDVSPCIGWPDPHCQYKIGDFKTNQRQEETRAHWFLVECPFQLGGQGNRKSGKPYKSDSRAFFKGQVNDILLCATGVCVGRCCCDVLSFHASRESLPASLFTHSSSGNRQAATYNGILFKVHMVVITLKMYTEHMSTSLIVPSNTSTRLLRPSPLPSLFFGPNFHSSTTPLQWKYCCF